MSLLQCFSMFEACECTEAKSCFFCPAAGKKLKAPAALLTWDVVHERMPWNIVLLLGGGFALASGSEVRAEGHCSHMCSC